MIGEVLANWMRLRMAGRISDLRRRAMWLARTADVEADSKECGRWLRDMSARGFVEVSWDTDRWSCAPLVLTRLPRADGVASLVGFSSACVDEALAELGIEYYSVPADPVGSNAKIPRPSTVYIQYDTMEELPSIAAALGAAFVPCAATQLAGALVAPVLGPETAGPNLQNQTLAYYSATELRPVALSTEQLAPGLYRYEANGRAQFLWFDSGQWRRCRFDHGIWFALRRAGVSAVRWRAYPGFDPDTGPGQLFVDWGAPLPDLHQRALVLCSGRTPKFADSAATAIYENVPRSIAEKTWTTLGQPRRII